MSLWRLIKAFQYENLSILKMNTMNTINMVDKYGPLIYNYADYIRDFRNVNFRVVKNYKNLNR